MAFSISLFFSLLFQFYVPHHKNYYLSTSTTSKGLHDAIIPCTAHPNFCELELSWFGKFLIFVNFCWYMYIWFGWIAHGCGSSHTFIYISTSECLKYSLFSFTIYLESLTSFSTSAIKWSLFTFSKHNKLYKAMVLYVCRVHVTMRINFYVY